MIRDRLRAAYPVPVNPSRPAAPADRPDRHGRVELLGARQRTLAGRTALVTGATGGVGLEIAIALARAGAQLILPARNPERARQAAARIAQAVPGLSGVGTGIDEGGPRGPVSAPAALRVIPLDLADLSTVAEAADILVREGTPIDLLVANAGIAALGDRGRRLTADGFERHFQTNYLGHAVLVSRLLPVLRLGSARLVLQISLATGGASVPFDDLQSEHGYSVMRAYRASKVELGAFGVELSRRSSRGGWGISVALAQPGVAMTGIAPTLQAAVGARAVGALKHGLIRARIAQDAADAARPAVAAALAPTPVHPDAAHPVVSFAPAGPWRFAGPPVIVPVGPEMADPAVGARLWEETRRFPGVELPLP